MRSKEALIGREVTIPSDQPQAGWIAEIDQDGRPLVCCYATGNRKSVPYEIEIVIEMLAIRDVPDGFSAIDISAEDSGQPFCSIRLDSDSDSVMRAAAAAEGVSFEDFILMSLRESLDDFLAAQTKE